MCFHFLYVSVDEGLLVQDRERVMDVSKICCDLWGSCLNDVKTGYEAINVPARLQRGWAER